MSIRPFAHAVGSAVDEVIPALSAACRPLAGGTDLLSLMKLGIESPERLVSLRAVPELRRIAIGGDGWRIGAATTLSQLAAEPSLQGRPEMSCLLEAVAQSASPQLRHMATLGGNLLQRPRCWYYRHPLVPCWRKGGQTCYAFRGENRQHVLFGGGPCHAVHPSDPAVALLALDAAVVLAGPAGRRTLPLGEFYRTPTRLERSDTVLALDELVIELAIPAPLAGSRGTYVKVADRAAWDFALASAAVQVTLAEGLVRQARVALGGVAPFPWRVAGAEQALVGNPLNSQTIAAAAAAATAGAKPLAHNAYKVDLLQGVVRQALERLV